MTLGLLCARMLAFAADLEPNGPTELAREYREVRAKAGRSADEQVRLALWCESHRQSLSRLILPQDQVIQAKFNELSQFDFSAWRR